jgi:hypothetical protein
MTAVSDSPSNPMRTLSGSWRMNAGPTGSGTSSAGTGIGRKPASRSRPQLDLRPLEALEIEIVSLVQAASEPAGQGVVVKEVEEVVARLLGVDLAAQLVQPAPRDVGPPCVRFLDGPAQQIECMRTHV